MTYAELKALGIPCWADNDGGSWFYEENGAETVQEDEPNEQTE